MSDPTAFYEAVRRIATACGSTGWVSSIVGVHNWHLALFDQQAQEEVWGNDRTVRVSWKQEVRAELRQIFNGAAFKLILDECTAIHQRVLRSRVWCVGSARSPGPSPSGSTSSSATACG